MATQIQIRRDTAANWTSNNPTLAIAEPGLETDTLKIKYGDGVTAWNSLSYSNSILSSLSADLDCNSNQILKASYTQIADNDTASGTVTLDYSLGDMIQLTATGNITGFTTSNFVTGAVCSMIIDAVNFGTYTITHPATWLFAGATAPTYTATGTDRLLLLKDKDDVFSLFVIGQDIGTV